jgi:hypothetical protein
MDLLSRSKDTFQTQSKSQLRSSPMIQQVEHQSLTHLTSKSSVMETKLTLSATTLLSSSLRPWKIKSTSTLSEEQRIVAEIFSPTISTSTPTTALTTVPTTATTTTPTKTPPTTTATTAPTKTPPTTTSLKATKISQMSTLLQMKTW